jgi:hypothetical protein
MRNGVASIVPLFLGIVLLFSFMIFMGGGSDTLHAVNNVKNLKHLQSKLAVPALQKKYESIKLDQNDTIAKANAEKYIQKIMYKNNIDTKDVE